MAPRAKRLKAPQDVAPHEAALQELERAHQDRMRELDARLAAQRQRHAEEIQASGAFFTMHSTVL